MIQSSRWLFDVRLLSLWLIFHITLPCIGGPQNKKAEFVASAVASTLQEAKRLFGFSGIVLAEVKGEIVAVIAVGSRDGNADHPITDETLFELGSLTKSFTAATCLVLEQHGKLTVDDGQQRVFHSGAVRGFLTSVIWYPGEDSSLIIMCNSDNKRSFLEVEQALVTILERQLLRTPQNQQFTAAERKNLAGTFSGKIANGRNLTISITESDSDKLDVSIDWGGGLKTQGVLAKRGKNQFSHLDITGSEVPLETHSTDDHPVDRISMFDANFNRN